MEELRGIFASALIERSQIYLFIGETDRALSDCNLGLSAKISERYRIKLSLLKAEFFLRGKKDYNEAEKIVSGLLGKPEISKIPELHCQAINLMGGIKRYGGDLDKALEYYGRALEFNLGPNKEHNRGIVATNIASIYHLKGRIDTAMEYLDVAQRSFERSGDPFYLADSKKDLGLMLLEKGEYARAEGLFLNYLKKAREINHKKGIAEVLNFLGYLYKSKGDLKNSFRRRNEYLKLAREMNDEYLICSALISLGVNYQETGDHARATGLLKKALSLAGKKGYVNFTVSAYLNLIGSYLATSDRKNAFIVLKKAEKLIEGIKNPNYSFHFYNSYAIYEEREKNFKAAAGFYELARMSAEQMDKGEWSVSVRIRKVECLRQSGDDTAGEESSLRDYAAVKGLLDILAKEEDKVKRRGHHGPGQKT